MDRNGLILGISAVLFGITALMLLVGVVVNPFFLFVALPFGGSAYLLWYQASGKLAERVERTADASGSRTSRQSGFNPGAFGAGASDSDRFSGNRARRGRGSRRRTRTNGQANQSTLSSADARRVLGVDDTASDDEIKTAYRQKVKQHHPDTDTGDEEMFKKVSRAYETLSE